MGVREWSGLSHWGQLGPLETGQRPHVPSELTPLCVDRVLTVVPIVVVIIIVDPRCHGPTP